MRLISRVRACWGRCLAYVRSGWGRLLAYLRACLGQRLAYPASVVPRCQLVAPAVTAAIPWGGARSERREAVLPPRWVRACATLVCLQDPAVHRAGVSARPSRPLATHAHAANRP